MSTWAWICGQLGHARRKEREAEETRKKNVTDVYSSSQILKAVAKGSPLDDVAQVNGASSRGLDSD